jgi:hypothetical protein
MRGPRRISLLIIGLLPVLAAPAWARIPATRQHHQPSAATVTPLSSIEGMARLRRAAVKTPLAGLVRNYEAQTRSMCGPTSAAVVLNALGSGHRNKQEQPRHTQYSVLACTGKSIRQIRGQEPVRRRGKKVIDPGLSLGQLNRVLRGQKVQTRLRRVTCASADKIKKTRSDLVQALSHDNCQIIANFSRPALGQRGNGHFSPIGAYDKVSDSFLVVDVNRRVGWSWVDAGALVKAMGPVNGETRGYLVVSK